MKQLVKINNSNLSFRLNLNYDNVFSRLRMLLGKDSSLFADISTKAVATTWYADDDEEYSRLSEAPDGEQKAIINALNSQIAVVQKELSTSSELSPYTDDILEIPDKSFVFYRKTDKGYKVILAGWGCKYAHQMTTDPGIGFIKHVDNHGASASTTTDNPSPNGSIKDILAGTAPAEDIKKEQKQETSSPAGQKPEANEHQEKVEEPTEAENPATGSTPNEPAPRKKVQHVILRVIDQNNKMVAGEFAEIRTLSGEMQRVTDDDGTIDLGNLPYGSTFSVTFPDIAGSRERGFEVEPNVEVYDAYIKKLVKYNPVLFVEDQNGNTVQNYNIKIVIAGQDSIYNTGSDGVIQLPTLQEGQKFIAIDTLNYANSEEYNVNQSEAKTPYHFHVRRAMKAKVGITVLDKSGKPLPQTVVDLNVGDTPCQQITGENGRAEFPAEVLLPGIVPVMLNVKGKGNVKSDLRYTTDVSEYTIQLQDKHPIVPWWKGWKWLGLIPLLLLCGWGGKVLYNKLTAPEPQKTPTIAEMESGVGLILVKELYYVDLKIKDITFDGNPLVAYFNYDMNTKEVTNLTFDPKEAKVQYGTGTGFLISKDGLIATNRHVAKPIPPDEVANYLKKYFQEEKNKYQETVDDLNDQLQLMGGLGQLDAKYLKIRKDLQHCQEQVRLYDRIINTGQFKVEVKCSTSIAFTNTRIEDEDDFIPCSQPRAWGEPGGINEIDLAIIQIKKKQDIPADAYIFPIPDPDLMDEPISDDYEVTVLGYHAGVSLQDLPNQDEGIKPQAQHGKVTNTSSKYQIAYDAPTMGGSSGSPVINKQGQLVAINNSGVSITQGFNFGVRTKYLKELFDKVNKKSENSDIQSDKSDTNNDINNP